MFTSAFTSGAVVTKLQTWWLQTTSAYPLSSGDRKCEIKPPQGETQGAILPWLFKLRWLPSVLGLWPHHCSPFLQLHMMFTSSPCMSQISLYLSLRRSGKIQDDFISRSELINTSAKTLYPNKVTTQVLICRHLRRAPFNPLHLLQWMVAFIHPDVRWPTFKKPILVLSFPLSPTSNTSKVIYFFYICCYC